ncbi:hypothetical protein QYM36_001623, partial [Artemia franciscana]
IYRTCKMIDKTGDMNQPKEEIETLAQRLDRELDEYIDSLPSKPYRPPETSDPERLLKEMEEHPIFMTKQPEEGESLPPFLEGIQQLRYDTSENTPEELATTYKENGNYKFKLKKYRNAITEYTEGLKQKCEDAELNAILYANRAASHFYLGNYRSSLSDCQEAVKLKKDYKKAILRAAQCCQKLSRFEEGNEWCDRGLTLDRTDEQLIQIRAQLAKEKSIKDRDRRKADIAERKLQASHKTILAAIKNRGIQVHGDLSMESLEPCHPAAINKGVHLEGETLVWPVLFMYPEYGETDFIAEFHENTTFQDHLQVIFGPESEPAPWDAEKKYTVDKLRVYFEDRKTNTLLHVPLIKRLNEILTNQRYCVIAGTPGFIVLVEGSKFQEEFIK